MTEKEKIIKELESLNLVFIHKPNHKIMTIEELKKLSIIYKEIAEGCYD